MRLYTLGIRLYGIILQIAALFNPKAKAWVEGRRQWKVKHQQAKQTDKPLLWIHCASLGEFEQGRPVIEGLKSKMPELRVLLTFFSPSGYEVRKGYAHADYVQYMPLDTPENARSFLDIWQPCIAVFVKYEFWYNHLQLLQDRQTPVWLIAGLFRPGQLFFRPFGGPFRRILKRFDQLYVQNNISADVLSSNGLEQYTVAGDTRIDRVWQIAENANEYPIVKYFVGSSPVLVVGSSWPEDEQHVLPFINQQLPADWKVIIAPHQIHENHLLAIEQELELEYVRYSNADDTAKRNAKRVMIIDNIGMLSSIYQYGKVAYIGGAFGAGLHNTLEPIAFGLPVIFGPRYQKFEEARYLVAEGGGFVIRDTQEISRVFEQLLRDEAYRKASRAALYYIEHNRGASRLIVEALLNKIGPNYST